MLPERDPTGDGAPLGSTPPAVGEITTRTRLARRRPLISKPLIAAGFVAASVTAGVILWLTDRLERKASAADVDRLRDETQELKQHLSGMGAQLGWLRADVVEIKAVLWRLAAREGIAVPAAPGTVAPLAPPVAP
jgi:hypothetical protein